MQHLRIKLLSSRGREGNVDWASCGPTRPTKTLLEACQRRGLLEHQNKTLGVDVDAYCYRGGRDDNLGRFMVSLHAFRHCDDVVRRGLPIEDEDPHGLVARGDAFSVGTVKDVQLSLQIRRHYISLLHGIGEDHGREPLLYQMLLDEQCKLLIRQFFLLGALLPRAPAQELEINSLLDAW